MSGDWNTILNMIDARMGLSVETQRREWPSLSEIVRKVNSVLSARFCKKLRHLERGGRRMVYLLQQ